MQFIATLGVAVSLATGFLWERSNRATTRLGRVLPLSDSAIGEARLAASLAAVLIAFFGITATLAAVLAGRAMTGHPMLPPGDTLPFLLALVVSGAPVWWIFLASGRILFLLTLAPIASGIATMMLFGEFLSESIYVLTAWLPVPVTIFALGLYAHRRIGTAIPWAWLGIAIPTSVLLLVNALYDSSSLAGFNTSLLKYGYPIAMAFATLHYAWASRLITKRRCLVLGAAFAVALPTLVFLIGLQPWNAGLVDRELAAYLAFGLLLPFVWFPLVARWQRNG
ncbi:MAG: hypothetical protein L3K26_02970 [Candidatus Hydrogenedentes bacterium]|nr:hypothetical protein [Candidatus Hydrogenedentota bacterium]